MTTQITPSEWEALSAFLDNQLSERDQVRLEARLKSEPELRQALDDLRRTRLILRSQPRMRAPRNFTLSPAAARVRTRRLGGFASPFYTLRLASVLAAVFLALITVGDLTVRRLAPEPRSVAMSEQVPAAPAMGMGGGGGGGGPEISALTAPTEAPAAVEAAPDQPALASEIPDLKTLAVTPLSPQATSQADPIAKLPPTVMEGPPVQAANGQPAEAQPADTAQARQPAQTSPLIRTLQALLALLAIGAGAAALWMRRTSG